MTLVQPLLLVALIMGLTLGCRSMDKRTAMVRPASKSLTSEPPKLAGDVPLPGKYLGFLRLEDKSYKIPFAIDLVGVKAKQQQASYHVIARYSLGAFDSEEFYSEFHPDVIYDSKAKTFLFTNVPNKQLFSQVEIKAGTLISGKVASAGQKPIGDFIAIYAGKRGSVDAEKYISQMFPDLAVLNTLAGTYDGECGGKKMQMGLEFVRWPQLFQKDDNFFSDYKVKGYFAQVDPILCQSRDVMCTRSVFSDVSFSLASKEVVLKGKPLDRTCTLTTNGLICNECQLTAAAPKTQDLMASVKRVMQRPTRDSQLTMAKGKSIGKSPDFPGSVEGEYFGYLFNEALGSNQLMRLKVNASFEKQEGMLKPGLVLSGISTLFFGNSQSNEFVVNRYRGGYFSESAPHYVFNGNGESFLQVTQWNEGSIRAVLYGKTFGRVGTVELLRGDLPPEPPVASQVSALSGTYSSANVRLNLLVQSNVSEHERDFFPLFVKGIASRRVDNTKKSMISAASYDPYTGHLALNLLDGTLAVGRLSKDNMTLAWPEPMRYGSVVAEQKPEPFIYEKDPFSGTTALQMFDLLKSSSPKAR